MKYWISFDITGSYTVEAEADSVSKAIELAEGVLVRIVDSEHKVSGSHIKKGNVTVHDDHGNLVESEPKIKAGKTMKYWFKIDDRHYPTYMDATDDVDEGETIQVMDGDTCVLSIPYEDSETWRQCSECGSMMQAGFYVESFEYYCSEECLKKVYSWEEYLDMYAEDIAYYTEWY